MWTHLEAQIRALPPGWQRNLAWAVYYLVRGVWAVLAAAARLFGRLVAASATSTGRALWPRLRPLVWGALGLLALLVLANSLDEESFKLLAGLAITLVALWWLLRNVFPRRHRRRR